MDTWRRQQLIDLGLEVRWLDEQHGTNAFEYAMSFMSLALSNYGLNPAVVSEIQRHHIESDPVARAWLKERISPEGTLQIIFAESEVCVISSEQFLAHWENIFTPARDDAVILHNLNKTILFYYHENDLEIGLRNNPAL